MSDDVKQVKVDNWGIYFLQRLKHFFNRTDYCDLTLQFQDNAQLKVHRLVLSACTEYFELLERTCEMYEDCLVMPDDLQADVVVPIVNFMYTGQLEFKMELLESLYQTSLIMNMPVLTKLLDAHRHQSQAPKLNYNATRRSYSKNAVAPPKPSKQSVPSNVSSIKRSHTKAFGSPIITTQKEKKQHFSVNKSENGNFTTPFMAPVLYGSQNSIATRKAKLAEPRPTRYELPEEIESEEVFDSSFTNISYTSQPLIVHPETTKRYTPKKNRGIFSDASSSKRTSTMDIVECKKVSKTVNNNEEDDVSGGLSEETELFVATVKKEEERDSSQLFDQILDHGEGPRVTIETKDKEAGNIDHAKIISEVLKKYPHLVKSNKNIKLKILNTPSATSTPRQRQPKKSQSQNISHVPQNPSDADYTFETEVLDSKEAARLISLGAENINGPWICLICGAPGRALHFPSYYKFRRHLVEVHNEKPVSKMCEYCGLKSLKRNYLLHHLYTKHGVEPPPYYHFPKCDMCNYVALTESFLIKHKLSHVESRNFRCNVCPLSYTNSKELLEHIRQTGHKYSGDRKANLQCVYCSKVFLRENNLYAHLKTIHSESAKADGIIEVSDIDSLMTRERDSMITKQRSDISPNIIKYEPASYDDENEDDENDEDDISENQYNIQQHPDTNILLSKNVTLTPKSANKQKILNSGLTTRQAHQKAPISGFKTGQVAQKAQPVNVPIQRPDPVQQVHMPAHKNQAEEIVMIDNNEYVLKGNQLILRKNTVNTNEEYIVPETEEDLIPSAGEFSNIRETMPSVSIPQQKMILEKTRNVNQPIQIVVSNEEEYKALMGSNHSIIFDETDSNKTLTVLSTPHTSLNTAALSMNTAQSNDMMIIPNNYQLNTSEVITSENPNIVVVYSDQIMTSHSIGAQFEQSSAVVTQNYETVTTTTPVMNARIINTQDVETWQKNIEEDIDSQRPEMLLSDELQQTVIQEETEHPLVENSTNDSDELPVVNVASELSKQVLPSEKDTDTTDQCDTGDNNMEVDDQVTQNELSTAMDIENMTKKSHTQHPEQAVLTVISNKPRKVDASESHLIDESAIIEHGPDISETEEVVEEHQNQPMEQLAIVEQNQYSEESAHIIQIEQSAYQPEDNLQESENTEVIDQENLTQEAIVSEHDVTIETSVSKEGNISSLEQHSSNIDEIKENTLVKSVAPEQLQTLTSEWSEDEEETEQESNNPAEGDLNMTENTTTMPRKSPERRQSTEETIENIQQEMQKQIDNTETEHVESNDDVQEQGNQQHESQDKQAIPSQEKISSLLNDWEDNDSQEDLTQNDEQSQETQDEAEDNKERENEESAEPKNEDKIKSLVSDWDDVEDEENKNE